ncbi:MAG: hypothetical protein R3C27_00095 [Hyphomonadaceae bacterium]
MSGWRDGEGRTAAERRKLGNERQRAQFFADVRYRPLTALKTFAAFAFVALLVFALVNMMT